MTTFVGFSCDRSGSMRSIAKAALNDVNLQLNALREQAAIHGETTLFTSVDICSGARAIPQVNQVNTDIARIQNHYSYQADGNATPLIDTTAKLIDVICSSAEYQQADENSAVLIIITTDGGENVVFNGHPNHKRLMTNIRDLVSTGRWTFVLRIPSSCANEVNKWGWPSSVNILPWDTTTAGMERATQANVEGLRGYYAGRAAGVKATTTFYADLAQVSSTQVAATLEDISAQVAFWPVSSGEDGKQIRDFAESRLQGKPLLKGAAFYQLTKAEKEVQANKILIVRDKTTKAVYAGRAARQLLNLPENATVKLAPGSLGNFEVFVQSTSVNRKVVAGSELLYWSQVGVAYKEGKSAR